MKHWFTIYCTLILSWIIMPDYSWGQTLLGDWFGVTLQLGDEIEATYYADAFDIDSFQPTLHTETTDRVIPDNTLTGSDWYGDWSLTEIGQYITYRGKYAEGEEVYDVEAMYFDNDQTNVYIAIVTSFPPPPGHQEQRSGYDGLVVSGDLALDLGLNSQYDDGFRYDYGVNINHEERNPLGNAYGNGSTIGTELYRTSNDDWYLGSPAYAVAANGELTNIDPEYAGFTGVQVGNVTVSYNLYDFSGTQENNSDTYVIEVTIPLSLLDNPAIGTQVGVGWVMGCRNDGNQTQACLRMYGDIDEPEIPVELTSFTAEHSDGAVTLKWTTQSETENLGFHIFRKKAEDEKFQQLNQEIIPSAGNSEIAHYYQFVDNNIVNGTTYIYRLADVDYSGRYTFHGSIEVEAFGLPEEFALHQNYPNPFNPETVIPYQLHESGMVKLVVYNLLGQPIRTLVDGYQEPGFHKVHWNVQDNFGETIPNGIFFYKLTSNGHTQIRKMILQK